MGAAWTRAGGDEGRRGGGVQSARTTAEVREPPPAFGTREATIEMSLIAADPASTCAASSAYSVNLRIARTASPMRRASASRNFWNSGASRYDTGVSTLAIAARKSSLVAT